MRLLSWAKRVSFLGTVVTVGCTSSTPAIEVPTDSGVDDSASSATSSTTDSGVHDAASDAASSTGVPADSGVHDAASDAASSTEAQADSGTYDAASDATADGGVQPTLLNGSIFGFSTVPPTGPADLNPYGVAVVPAGFPTGGTLQPGDILVSNFNGPTNVQGTGTTVTRITPLGQTSTFFVSPQVGLTDALAVLTSGLVIVGNVPNESPDGGSDGGISVGTGSLQVLDSNGNLLQTITDPLLLADPWGLAVNDEGDTAQLFVSNVITGSVTRLDVSIAGTTLTVNGKVEIAAGYATRTDPSAFVLGPGGMVYDATSGTLYLSSEDEEIGGVEAGTIFAIADAGTLASVTTVGGGKGTAIYADVNHLHGPIGLAQLPNGDLIAANADGVNANPAQPSELVEFTPAGDFVDEISVDPNTGGGFGMAVGTVNGQAVFAAVDDNQVTLTEWETGQPYHPILELSTVPPTGPADLNPYGVAVVPAGVPTGGALQPGDILVSNFNGPTNVQGTGTTVIHVTPLGQISTFFTSPQLGLTEALAVLKSGLVIVGNVPNASPDGASSDGGVSVGTGSLQVLDSNGNLLQTITDSTLLADPWGLAVNDEGGTAQLFVSNVITGSVTRLDVSIAGTTLTVNSEVQIAAGYATRTDPSAFVLGPGGMVYDATSGTLYLSSEDEKIGGVEAGTIFAIPNAGTLTSLTSVGGGKGTAIYADVNYLRGPIGLAQAPNGDLIAANADGVNADPAHPSELVEITPAGDFVDEVSVDPSPGAGFGVTFGASNGSTVLAALNDNQVLLSVRSVP